jgi:hypothetical protein
MDEFTMEDYLPSARNFFDYLGVRAQEQVLLTPTLEFLQGDPLAVETLQHVCRERDIHVAVAVVEALGTRGEPPKNIARAIEASDVFITMGDKNPNPITGHCLTALRARWDYGVKQVDLMGGKGVLATECARFPVEILLAIARSVNAQLQKGNQLEVVDDKGTDFKFPYHPSEVFFGANFDCGHLGPGQRIDWPLGQIIIHAGDAFSGIAMMECIKKIPRILEKPVKYVIANCVTEIEEREETRHIRAELAKPENTNLAGKLFLGVNPKGSASEGVHRSGFGNLRQAAGVASVYIGDKAGYVASEFTTSGYLLKPTILLNKEVICDHGRLAALDDPGVRKIASKYGDPDQLLAQLS